MAESWHARIHQAQADGFAYVHALVNEGRAAGASLLHSHSQLVWMRESPPAVVAEHPEGVERLLARDDLVVAEREDVVAVVHPAGRAPYELLLAPRSGRPTTESDVLGSALELLAEIVGRIRALEGAFPWNAWVHDGPHWHLELVPRLTVFAGVELGAGVYVNPVAPEDAAAALRGDGR